MSARIRKQIWITDEQIIAEMEELKDITGIAFNRMTVMGLRMLLDDHKRQREIIRASKTQWNSKSEGNE